MKINYVIQTILINALTLSSIWHVFQMGAIIGGQINKEMTTLIRRIKLKS